MFLQVKVPQDKAERLIEYWPGRIETTIKCSKIYHDGKHQELEENLHENGDVTVTCHRNRVSTYTSVIQIQRYLKRQKPEAPPSHIHLRRQDNQSLQAVVFNSIPYLCKDPKHPARWRLAYLCREIKNKWEKQSKQLILEAYAQRNRGWGNEDFKSQICPKETTPS